MKRIDEIRSQNIEPIEIAIELCMYCMKTQVFKDGNYKSGHWKRKVDIQKFI